MELSKHRFNSLQIDEQVQLAFNEGQEVLSRIYLYYTVKLYSLSSFYVEVWYRPHHNRIDRVEAVELDDVIHLYEREIDISDIFAR